MMHRYRFPTFSPPRPWSRKIPVVSNSARKERTPQHIMHRFTHFLRFKDTRLSSLSVGACSTRFTHHGRQRILNATVKRTPPRYTKFKILYPIQIPRWRWRSAVTVKSGHKPALRGKTCQDQAAFIFVFLWLKLLIISVLMTSKKRFIARPNNPSIIGSAILLSWPEICLKSYVPV